MCYRLQTKKLSPERYAASIGREVPPQTSAKARSGKPLTFAREGVIETAVENFRRDGIDEVPLNEIRRRAGSSKPGVYREFGGEDGPRDAALEYYAAKVLAPQLRQRHSKSPTSQRPDRPSRLDSHH